MYTLSNYFCNRMHNSSLSFIFTFLKSFCWKSMFWVWSHRVVLLDKKVREIQIESAKKVLSMLDESLEQQKELADICPIRSPGYIAAWTILHAEKTSVEHSKVRIFFFLFWKQWVFYFNWSCLDWNHLFSQFNLVSTKK